MSYTTLRRPVNFALSDAENRLDQFGYIDVLREFGVVENLKWNDSRDIDVNINASCRNMLTQNTVCEAEYSGPLDIVGSAAVGHGSFYDSIAFPAAIDRIAFLDCNGRSSNHATVSSFTNGSKSAGCITPAQGLFIISMRVHKLWQHGLLPDPYIHNFRSKNRMTTTSAPTQLDIRSTAGNNPKTASISPQFEWSVTIRPFRSRHRPPMTNVLCEQQGISHHHHRHHLRQGKFATGSAWTTGAINQLGHNSQLNSCHAQILILHMTARSRAVIPKADIVKYQKKRKKIRKTNTRRNRRKLR